VSDQEARLIIAEFRELFSSNLTLGEFSEGGIDTARRLLYTAFGEEKGEVYLHRAVPEAREIPLNFRRFYGGANSLSFKQIPVFVARGKGGAHGNQQFAIIFLMQCFDHLTGIGKCLFIENKGTKPLIVPVIIVENNYIHGDLQLSLFPDYTH